MTVGKTSACPPSSALLLANHCRERLRPIKFLLADGTGATLSEPASRCRGGAVGDGGAVHALLSAMYHVRAKIKRRKKICRFQDQNTLARP